MIEGIGLWIVAPQYILKRNLALLCAGIKFLVLAIIKTAD